jgi:REP-associated tyrosine transposase
VVTIRNPVRILNRQGCGIIKIKLTNTEVYLEPSSYYHIYNRAVGSDKLFHSEKNYLYFLKKYNAYISPIAERFAYCLIPNHFHFLIRIKDDPEIDTFFNAKRTLSNSKSQYISKQFSNFFNGYSQAINKQQSRHGSLLSRPFKRKHVNSLDYLRNVILYIHLNPVNHKLVQRAGDWTYSSYNTYIIGEDSEFKRKVIDWFEDLENMILVHEKCNGNKLIELE